MLFMTVSSVITGARLDRVQQALGALTDDLERVRHLMEAGNYARFESAAEHLDEVGAHFEHGRRFTGFMEGRGRGWLIMRREMLAFNGTEPQLLHDEPNRFVRVTFRLVSAGG